MHQFARALLFGWMVFFAASVGAQNISIVSETKPSANSLEYGDIWGDGDLACLGIFQPYSSGGFGVGVFNITNPAAPVQLANYYPSPTSNNQFEQGLIRNKIGYFASWSGSGGLHIVSLTNPASPLLLSRITGTVSGAGIVTNGHDRVHTMFLDRNFVYLADHITPTVKVFDISNPFAPTFVRDIVTTNTVRVHQITVATNGSQIRLYTSGWGNANANNPPGKTDIWDVTAMSVSQAPTWLGAVITGNRAHSSWPTPDGNHLVICREISGGEVSIWNISNPAEPVLASALTTGGVGIEAAIPHNPVVVDDTLFVAWYQAGLQMFNIANPARPVRIGSLDTRASGISGSFQGNWGVYPFLGFDKVLLSDMQRGMLIVDVRAAFTATNNYRPLILQQPDSQTVTQGQSVSFSVDATGSATLAYQWRLNGTNVPGGTSTNLTLNSVQAAQAGSYTVVVSNGAGSITSRTAVLNVILPEVQETWQTIFRDEFETDSSTNWLVFAGSANGIDDYTAEFAYDYGTYFSTFLGTNLPPAPDSAGTTRGLKLTVNNNDAVAALAGVSLYPKEKFFSGAYRLRFDMWMNYIGGPGGGPGSTEWVTFGLNHTGTRVNWENSTSTPSDGVWFSNNSDGANASDYRAYVGRTNNSPSQFSFATSGIAASGAVNADSGNVFFQGLFPSPTYETPGVPNKHWVQVELSQSTNNVLTWRINGTLIAQRTNTSMFTNGNVMIGYADLNTSIPATVQDQFIMIDNVTVDVLTTSVAPVIVSQPLPATVYPGDNTTFSVGVTGSDPLAFQWRFNGLDIPGATESSYTRNNAQTLDQGLYSVVITNAVGSVTSSNAPLSLLQAGVIRNVRATPGARAAIVTWETTVPSTSQVTYDIAPPAALIATNIAFHSEFGTVSYISPIPTTNHSILLSGLQPDSTYFYEAVSFDGTDSHLSGEYNFKTAGTIIIDNPDAAFTGTWTHGATSATNKYLTNYSFTTCATLGAPTAGATFRPTIVTPGKYDVYAWYSHGNNRAPDAPYLVSFDGGSETVRVNQRTNGGSWQLIAAAKPFAAGSGGFVRLLNDSTSPSSVVIADAVRWVYVEEATLDVIPAWWSQFYFASNANTAIDHDADGIATADEYIWGTSPTDFFSRGHFELHRSGSNLHAMVYPHLDNREYQLFVRSNLTTDSWTAITNVHFHADPLGKGHITISNAAPHHFYRMQIHYSTNTASHH